MVGDAPVPLARFRQGHYVWGLIAEIFCGELVAAQPTQGLDVGAADYVQRCLLDVRERGGAVVLVSNDLDELLKLSDALIVLYRGRVNYEASLADVSIRTLALAMAGTDSAEPVAEVV